MTSAKNVNLHDKFLVFQEISCVHLFTFANEQCRADKFLKVKRHGWKSSSLLVIAKTAACCIYETLVDYYLLMLWYTSTFHLPPSTSVAFWIMDLAADPPRRRYRKFWKSADVDTFLSRRRPWWVQKQLPLLTNTPQLPSGPSWCKGHPYT